MNPIRIPALTLLAAALTACSSVPPNHAQLDRARSAWEQTRADGRTAALAPTEMRRAGDALARAEASLANGEDAAQTDHLAYIARQRSLLAREVADRKQSEAVVADASAQSDKLRLDLRTREVDVAVANATAARQEAASSQQQLVGSREMAARSQQLAVDVRQRNQVLQTQLRELNAQQTERGMVVTMGDVLFDTGRSGLRTASAPQIERLGSFLKAHPKRKAMIEGYTDSTGSDELNLALSDRRASAVMAALLGMGVDRLQLASQGHGETHPVANNQTAVGRQMNRRVEVVLSGEGGMLPPR